jgi:hypothetical protein
LGGCISVATRSARHSRSTTALDDERQSPGDGSKGDWHWKLWLDFGIFVWAFSFLNGVGYLGRRAIPIAERLEIDGYTGAVATDFGRWTLAARIEMTLLILVVLDMALKPGL